MKLSISKLCNFLLVSNSLLFYFFLSYLFPLFFAIHMYSLSLSLSQFYVLSSLHLATHNSHISTLFHDTCTHKHTQFSFLLHFQYNNPSPYLQAHQVDNFLALSLNFLTFCQFFFLYIYCYAIFSTPNVGTPKSHAIDVCFSYFSITL